MKSARLFCIASVVLSLACNSQGGVNPPAADPPGSTPRDPIVQPTPSEPSSPEPQGPVTPTTPPPEEPELPPPPIPDEARPFVLPPLQKSVRQYELLMPEDVLQKFYVDKDTPEQPATFRCDGVDYPVLVRLRGASARDFPKKSWNVSFEDEVRFEDRTSLNLVAGYSDATMLAEKISFDLLAAMRVPAANVNFVRLSINGRNEGVFLDIEQINKAFLRAHDFADKDASIYRAGWKDTELKLRSWKVPYQGDWKKKTNEKKENDDALDAVLAVINRTPEPQLVNALTKSMDIEGYVRSMVMDALMANNYIEDSESYFIFDHVKGQWFYAAWDLNNVDARWWHQMQLGPDLVPIYRQPLYSFTLGSTEITKRYKERKGIHPGYLPVFSNLGTRVVLNPALRARLEARLDKALQELFTLNVMGPYIDQMHALIAPYMAQDPYMDPAKFQAGRAFMRDFVRLRRDFILKERERLRAQEKDVVIEALDAKAGWVELRNRSTQPRELNGLTVTTNLRRAIPELLLPEPTATPPEQVATGAPVGKALPARMLAPGERVRLTAASLGLTFMPEGEIGLFDGQSVSGMKDALFYGRLADGQHYERSENGTWRIR
ncbi:CotH kinase family protein [Melittangium boletus]|uniref:Inner spore coat protein H n=1 Tax=Melittangium boletus DSM 14713 TaxID=1294270 RepID=A0A250ILH3_9BACT|nr:CotH kinase family protein [Melittangium boletus]ATB31806.1 inner spore coat protein H [Melittangium boletus DSM 14713]